MPYTTGGDSQPGVTPPHSGLPEAGKSVLLLVLQVLLSSMFAATTSAAAIAACCVLAMHPAAVSAICRQGPCQQCSKCIYAVLPTPPPAVGAWLTCCLC